MSPIRAEAGPPDGIAVSDGAGPPDGIAVSDGAGAATDMASDAPETVRPHAFRAWRRRRPFIGGLLVALGGVELFFSGQLDIGRLHVQLGIEGLQATIIPVALVLLGALAVLMPAHHVFYGILALVVAIYSLIGVNLGGFIVGMLIAGTGAVLVVAWMGPPAAGSESEATTGEEAA